jgi:hypothetical protein
MSKPIQLETFEYEFIQPEEQNEGIFFKFNNGKPILIGVGNTLTITVTKENNFSFFDGEKTMDIFVSQIIIKE